MVEKIYDTLKGILYNDLPKDAIGNVVIYDRPVRNWFIGDRDVKPANLSIMIYSANLNIKDIAFGLQEYEYKIIIGVDAGADETELSERIALEGNRLIISALRKHRRMWVVDLCPICSKQSLSPVHFTSAHPTILNSYVSTATTNFQNSWNITHTNAYPAPTLPASGLATEAFYLMYEDVRNNVVVNNLPTAAKNNILSMQKDNVEPIRMLYDCVVSDNKPSDDGRGQALLKTGQITFTAKEVVKQTIYGPDNVPSTAY